MIESYSTEIVRKAGAVEIVGCRDEAIRLYREAFRLIGEAKALTKRATGSDHAGPDLRQMTFYDIAKGEIDRDMLAVTKSIDTGVWEYLLDAIGLKAMMDATAIEEFRKQNTEAPPPVTMDNIAATLNDLGARRIEIFDRGVVSLFSRLDRTFKTNPSFRVDKKIIIKDALSTTWSGWNHWRSAQDQVRDLDRILHMLDGKPAKDQLADAAAIVGRVERKPATVETEYLDFKLCANGNLHISFKRPDLVQSINRIIAAHFGATLGHDRRARKAA